MIVDGVESISQSPLHKRRGSSIFFIFIFLHYWPSLCVRLPSPVFSITLLFCHRRGSKCPLSLWPSITRRGHLRQVLRYSNKPSPDVAEAASLLKHLWELWNDRTRCWSGGVTTVDSGLPGWKCVARERENICRLLLCTDCTNTSRCPEVFK